MSKKKFLGFLDIAITEIISQKNQTILMKNYLTNNNSELVFYTTESYLTLENLKLLESKLTEKLAIEGIVFYSLLQFCYNGNFLFKMIEKILNKKLIIYFVREEIQIKNIKEFKKNKLQYRLFSNTHYSLIKNLKNNFYKIKKID